MTDKALQSSEPEMSSVHGATVRVSSRERKPTEKGIQYEIELCERGFRSAVSDWRNCVAKMSVLMSDETDIQAIRDGRNQLNRSNIEVNTIFSRLIDLLGSDNSAAINFTKTFEESEIDFQNLMCKIADRILELQAGRSDVNSKSFADVSPRSVAHSSRSGRSRKSNSVVPSQRSDVVAKVAALKAKLKFIDAESKAKLELERVVTQKQIEMAQAKVDAIDNLSHFSSEASEEKCHTQINLPEVNKQEYVQSYVQHSTLMHLDQDTVKKQFHSNAEHLPDVHLHSSQLPLNPNAGVFLPSEPRPRVCNQESAPPNPNVSPHVDNGILNLTQSLSQQLALSRLPPPEPGIFNGDPLKYPGWKSAFHILIEQRDIPASEKIHYLWKYLGQDVREVVSNFFLLGTEDAYEEAKSLLDKRFGDQFTIANAFRDKLEKWQKIQPRDGFGLRRFADFLKQCHIAMASVGSLSVLNDERENRKLLCKLPEWILGRWNRHAVQWKEERNAFPPFKEFMRFIDKEATIACDPVTSLQSLRPDQTNASAKRVDSSKPDTFRASRKVGSFLANSKGNETVQAPKVDTENPIRKECLFCKRKNHEIDSCRDLLAKPMADRKVYARQQGLCFACLQKDQVAKFCVQRKVCQICKQKHPTVFHGNHPTDGQRNGGENQSSEKPSVSGRAFMSFRSSGRMSSMIVPVYVSHESCPEREHLVYALLDSQSDTTFVHDSTCEALGLTGTEVNLMLSTMYAENRVVPSRKVKGLVVRGYNGSVNLPLPNAYTRRIMPANRDHIPTRDLAKRWPHFDSILDEIPPLLDCEVGLLIGYNCSQALLPRQVIAPDDSGPFAQRTDLGWGIVGVIEQDSDSDGLDQIGESHKVVVCEVGPSLVENGVYVDHVAFAFRNKVKEVFSPDDVVKMMNLEFSERVKDGNGLSVEDQRFLEIVGNGVKQTQNHYEMPLPLRDESVNLPHNKYVAVRRLGHLKRRLKGDETFRNHYCFFMEDMIRKGYAEKVPAEEVDRNDGRVFYIPHHGVYNQNKPGKIRIVFDCSAKFKGESLNKHLLQGPDLANNLMGVLCRFRKERVAILCDIEQMFFQFRVVSQDRDLLRFLWWEDNNFDSEPLDFRMCVHLFGASSSPGCANFALKQIATDFEGEFGHDVANFVRRDFYVDDGLTSRPSEEEALNLIVQTKGMLSKGGLRLHKFVSSSKSLLQQLPPEDLAKSFMEIDLLSDSLPIERALGVQWAIESDCFQFKITLSDKPLTRRGILSTVNSVYDPLGFISPVILVGKQILQLLCADQLDWDSPVPEPLQFKWERWRKELLKLATLEIDRCYKPVDFGKVTSAELHHFSDASQYGYGQCSYLRLVDEGQRVHCSLVMGKSRVAPLKPVTIPRLELTAAVVSVKIGALIQRELDLANVQSWYWTDSKVVLGYINNEARRFHIYVANRVQQIHEHTKMSQWRYVETSDNPADIASRGITAAELTKGCIWFTGPKFLWNAEMSFLKEEFSEISVDDCELRKVRTCTTQGSMARFDLHSSFKYFSCWLRLKKAVAYCLKYVEILKFKVTERKGLSNLQNKGEQVEFPVLNVADLEKAECVIIRVVQEEAFGSEVALLKCSQECSPQTGLRRSCLPKGSVVAGLDPFLDGEGILRVGGRLKRSQLSLCEKNPIILPRKGHITELIVRHFHELVNHQGRGMTVNKIRANGLWVIGLSSAVYTTINKCVTCRRFRSYPQGQKMSDLPSDRLEPAPPFSYTGVDYFGPWLIREGRKEMKRYGVIFTCLGCRAIHLEIAASLSTDSFINALRRFMSIRGPVRELRSDRGTNFVGAERELATAMVEMDKQRINQFLLGKGCDNLLFKMNPPHASHMGGVWERQIRSVRNVLSLLLHQHGAQLNDESLHTLMCEAAAIVNSRPLTTQNLCDPLSLEPLTPNHLLTMKSDVILPPPGCFQKTDLYSRKYWRRVQYLANQFWLRWRKEYLQNLQVRKKWLRPVRNCSVGDIVLVADESLPRSQWLLARVVEAHVDEDGLVRKVKVAVGTCTLDDKGRRQESISHLERPIHKLVMICETEESQSGSH